MLFRTAGGRALFSPRTRAALLLILFAGALWASATVRDVFLIGFLGVLLGALLTFPIDFFSRLLPRGIALVATLILLVGVAFGVAWLAVPFVVKQGQQLAEKIPQAISKLQGWWAGNVGQRLGPTAAGGAAQLGTQIKEKTFTVASLAQQIVPAAFTTASVLAGAVYVVALGFFFAHEPERYHRALRALVPAHAEEILDETWRRVGVALRHWMAGILVSMALMGTLTAVGLWIAGVDGWPTLAVLTFFGTFVPYVGAAASAIPGLAVGLAESPRRFLYALIVYLCVHLVEGYLVQPLVMKRAVSLRPAALLFWQVLIGGLFGVLGLVAATPLLACVTVALDYLYVERVLEKQPAP